MIRKKVVSLKEGKQLFLDDSLHSLRTEGSGCDWAVVRRVRFVSFLGIGKMWSRFQEEGNIPSRVGKLKEFV